MTICPRLPQSLACLALLILSGITLLSPVLGESVSFNRDIRPLLSSRCFECHGPDEHERKANLRLDQAEGPQGAYRTYKDSTALKPESLSGSALWERITSRDAGEVMPPPEAKKKPLTDEEKQLVKRWIEQGAPYEDFWAFVPPKKPAPARVENEPWSRHPIDRFVLRKLEAEGLSPNPEADRRTLIRRLTFDLTGLPPTREEIHDYLADSAPGAYERLVERLLGERQYGEHMAKFWLDLVRFADTNGIHHDHYREMTPYRDWVIRAFNANLPYDQFVKYQLAGDLYEDPSRDQLIASGFNRLHLIIDVGTALPEESYTRNVIDRVTSVGTAFLGLTVQCAVCHDHKYDPITAKDFYRLFAYFNNLDAPPETGGRSGTDFLRGLQPPYINLTTPEQEATLEDREKAVMAAASRVRKGKRALREVADEAERETLTRELQRAEKALQEARSSKDQFVMSLPAAMIMKEREDRRPAHILIRGAYDNPGERVERGTPAFLPASKSLGTPQTRLDLAEWFVDRENPLTARVAVNRFWQQLFGAGIVKTSEDFGSQGEWPSHPDLLDYLAVSFMDSAWDIKALLKQIVLSKTYRQASEATPEEFKKDPENRLLARGSRYRMDSEMIRDQILATSGLLNGEMFGKSVKPPQPAGLWKSVSMPSSYPKEFEPDKGGNIYRRSVYTFWKRGMPPPQMTILNAPTREACIARRERTNTPLQALLLMNEQEFIKAARHLAHRLLTDVEEEGRRLTILYETITSRLPDAAEKKTLLDAYEDLLGIYEEDAALAKQLAQGMEPAEGHSHAELAAWTMLATSLYNLDITKTRQ